MRARGLILARSDELTRKFGVKRPFLFSLMKIHFGTTLVLLSVVIALIFTGGLAGLREGTVAAALCVGFVVQLVIRLLEPVSTVEKANIELVATDEPPSGQ